MIFGKTIKLFLIDGETNGRLTCELSNWTGKAYKIPRNTVKNSVDRPELQTTGVYMLIGKSFNISEKDRAEMEEFLSNILTLVNTLGYNAFEQIRQQSEQINIEQNKDLFYINAVRGAMGIGKATSEGFVVYEKSQMADPVTNSYPKTIQKLRDMLIKDGIIINQNNKFVLSKDYLFSSSSAAAMIILGRSANGLTEWKLKSGKTLQEYEMRQ